MAARDGWAYRIVVALVALLMRLSTRPEWRGRKMLQVPGGVLVCANHLSEVDPLTLGLFLHRGGRPPRFLAKESLFRVPVVGALLRDARQIPVARGAATASGSLDAAVRALEVGECVVVYPEGTLTRDPQLWPMAGRTGAARLALRSGCPVVPVAQWGPQRVLPPYGRRPRLWPRSRVQVWAGPPVPLDDLRAQPMTATVLRQATERILDAIAGILAQQRGEPVPARRFDPAA